MELSFSDTLSNPALERAFMESYSVRMTERLQYWTDMFRDLSALSRYRDIDGFAVCRELHRQVKDDLRVAGEALHTLSRMKPDTWGASRQVLEESFDSLENSCALWTSYSVRLLSLS